jgi:hypothetical protein
VLTTLNAVALSGLVNGQEGARAMEPRIVASVVQPLHSPDGVINCCRKSWHITGENGADASTNTGNLQLTRCHALELACKSKHCAKGMACPKQ